MSWVADISRPAPGNDDVKVAGAPVADPPGDADDATTGLEYGQTTERLDGVEPPWGEVTRDDLPPVPQVRPRAAKRTKRTKKRPRKRIKVLGVAIVMTIAGGAIGVRMLTSGGHEASEQTPVQAQGPPPLTDAQRKAAEASRLRELKVRASRAARDDDSRPMLFTKGAPPVTKTPKPAVKNSSSPDLGGPTPVGEAQRIARAMLPDFGWSPSSQFGCLVDLWNKESGWNTHAANPSGAYGIPQALPGSKMASAGSDWRDSAHTQIKWGLGYIKDRYGTPCAAWRHSESTGWY